MVLRCQLPPDVYAAIYDVALEWHLAGNFSEFFDDQFRILGIGPDWLPGASAQYRALQNRGVEVLDSEHAILASWLLAREKEPDPPGRADRFEVQVLESIGGGWGAESFIMIGWVVGQKYPDDKVLRCWGQRGVAIPGPPLRNEDVSVAFEGLLEHAAAIARCDLKGELACTSLVTRLGGLVDGLMPRSDPRRFYWEKGEERQYDINERLDWLRGQVKEVLGAADRAACDAVVCRRGAFAHQRNVLVHIEKGPAVWSFTECAAQLKNEGEGHDLLANHLATASAIVFGQAAADLLVDPWRASQALEEVNEVLG